MEQVNELCRRLRLPPSVKEKSLEYQRLAGLKSPQGLQPSVVAAISVELACSQQDEPVDKQYLQRLSGLSARAYSSTLQTIRQLLQLSNCQPSLRDLAIRFGCLEAEETAKRLIKSYEQLLEDRYTPAQRDNLQLSQSLYSSSALYCACKLLKIRCDKKRYFALSGSTQSLFTSVVDDMHECSKSLKDHSESTAAPECEEMESELEEGENDDIERRFFLEEESLDQRLYCNASSEDYLTWKNSIIANARRQLRDKTEEEP